jgi:hypothetical protein
MTQLEFSDRLGKMRIQAFALGLALAWATIGAVRAADADFVFTITGGDKTTTFVLDPTLGKNESFFFFFPSVSATIEGSPATLTNLTFWDAGGFNDNHYFNFFRPQFYNGTTFLPGVYTQLTNKFTGKVDTVTVVDPPPPAVPEISTWAMLLLGFVGLSYAGYKKAKTRTTLVA